jgi:hypothetical protein
MPLPLLSGYDSHCVPTSLPSYAQVWIILLYAVATIALFICVDTQYPRNLLANRAMHTPCTPHQNAKRLEMQAQTQLTGTLPDYHTRFAHPQ